MSPAPLIPVARPRLPPLSALAPYIARIDAARWYSNFGPLCDEFEARLAAQYGLPPGGVRTISNATVGLDLGLKAAGARPGTLCLVPSWTFAASVHAVVEAGMTPCFVDVDEEGVLTPGIARQALGAASGEVGAVMPVAVCGQPLDPEAWDQFADDCGVPVVIDAAPGFDSARPGRALTVVSLHATKALGVGEGGFVMSTDPALPAQVRQRGNFGFEGSRDAAMEATNGKLSEYACAVGLAGLDEWPARREAFRAAALRYRRNLADAPGIALPDGWGEAWQSTTCVVRFSRPIGDLPAALRARGVDSRAWWGAGMHLQPAFAAYPRLSLPGTERLAQTTLGLPFYIDMTPEEIDLVCTVLREEFERCR